MRMEGLSTQWLALPAALNAPGGVDYAAAATL